MRDGAKRIVNKARKTVKTILRNAKKKIKRVF